jgi:hypothetical protein
MKLIQVSDLHIKHDTKILPIQNIIGKMVDSLKNEIKDKEEIVFCVLGDIIDRGNSNAFPVAKKILDMIKKRFIKAFPTSLFSFEFVPGNHDLVGCDHLNKKGIKKDTPCPHTDINSIKPCNTKIFDEFIREFQTLPYYGYSSKNFHVRSHGNINLLLLNSAIGQCEYGKIEIDILEKKFKKPTIVITHHALMSLYDSDGSAIREGNTVLERIKKNNVIAMLHGHVHSYVYTDVGLMSKCIIGVGPFLKDVPNINKQFNVFDIRGSSIYEIKNFIYLGDGSGKFLLLDKPTCPCQNNFSGDSLKKVYDDVVTATRDNKTIRNLRMHLNCKYDSFKEEINNYFHEYIQQAEDWQSAKLNEKWYFNHGERMQYKDLDGMDYVIDELRNKPQGGKAIIPLMNFSDVVNNTNNADKYLPSLISVQFCFSDDAISELICTVYLRSLEVAKFLNINLCEVYIMCEKIIDKNRGIQTIDLTIFAFRTLYEPNFGCFRKAKLDKEAVTTEGKLKLHRLIINKNVAEIVKKLEEKKRLEESIINVEGITTLKKALEDEDKGNYSLEVLEAIKKLVNVTNELKKKRTKHSLSEVNNDKKEINKCYDNLIRELNKIG